MKKKKRKKSKKTNQSKLRIDKIIITVIFILLSIASIIILHWWGILTTLILLLLLICYFNSNKIADLLKNKTKNRKNTNKKEKKKKDDEELDNIILNENKDVDTVKVTKKNKKGNKKNNKKTNNTKENKKQKKKRSIWKILLTIVILFFCLIVFAVAAFFGYIAVSTSDFNPEALANQDQTVIYDVDGNVITTIGREKRESINYDQLPEVLVDAILATEDSRFFQHNGVDLARFMKASVLQVLGQSDAGGASTLTMQVDKNNLTSTERSIIRKFKDVYLSLFYMEKKYTKEEIIEFYVNDSLLGGNVYGVGQASEYYFGKSVSELSLAEASLLAGMFQSPNGYNPYYYPEKAQKRRETVLNLMVRHGYITQEEADLANAVDIESMLVEKSADETSYQGFIDTVVEEVIDKTDNDPYMVAMKIYTTMDRDMQDGINAALNGETFTWENDVVQAGIAIVNVETGGISAIGAGRNREGERTYNFATMAIRQPGSTAKPIFDYAPGMEYNNFSTYTLFNDEPWTYSNSDINVNNWDGGYQGLITLKQALSVSRNVPALKAFQQVNKKDIEKFVTSIGIKPDMDEGVLYEAHSIGGFTGVTPLQMAGAYASFASGGYYTKPYTVTKIEYRENNEVEEFKPTKEKVMESSTAYLMNNVLEYAVNYGFNGGARVSGSHVAAKTGTSNFDEATMQRHNLPGHAVNDLWTVAYTSKYSVALWYGYEETSSEYYNTSGSPKDSLMRVIMQNVPVDPKGWEVPDTVVASQVEMGTWPAQLPSANTPSDLIITEYFKKGTQPTEVSQRYSQLPDVSNLKATSSNGNISLTWNFTEPEIVTEKYLREYYSQPVFGNGTNSFVQQRLSYNSSTLGGLGFSIYQKSSDGTLSKVGFTTNKSYTFTPRNNGNSNISIVVKAEYRNFAANASKGVETKVSVNGLPQVELKVSLNGSSEVTCNSGNYEEKGITVYDNNKDVTNDATISYSISGNGTTVNPTSQSDLESTINSYTAGTYTITYTISYNNNTSTKTRKVIIK